MEQANADKNNSFVIRGNVYHTPASGAAEAFERAFIVCRDGKCAGIFEELPGDCRDLPLKDYGDALILPGMVDLHLQYKAAATYPQRLRIVTSISRYAPKKLELTYRCYAEGRDEPINTAVTFHIWTGPDNRSCDLAVTLPEVYRKIEEAAE